MTPAQQVLNLACRQLAGPEYSENVLHFEHWEPGEAERWLQQIVDGTRILDLEISFSGVYPVLREA